MRNFPGNGTGTNASDSSAGGWITTRVAGAALGVGPRQVRNMISEGLLESRTEGEGVNRRYLVSVASVEALRNERTAEGKMPGKIRDVTDEAVGAGHPPGETAELFRELAAELGETRYRLGRAEARLELTAEAESTVREALERERERADQERARADRLEAEVLEVRRAVVGPPEMSAAGGEVVEAPETPGGSETAPQRRSWWRRFFGFE